jgi:flavin-dependent thymidylate synthase
MRVVLAGYNVDAELLEQAVARGVDRERLTPEVLSAAYARISRNPAPVDELRAAAREEVARARASNAEIVFGLGHASVAEHAVFNFDLLGLSRLAIEAVEAFRLCSYTEKSQRYIKLEDDFVAPEEIVVAGLEPELRELCALQHASYDRLYERLLEHQLARHPELAAERAGRRTLEGWAKEDARYVTSLAVCGQLGLTANARSLEHMVRRLAGHPLAEVRSLAAELAAQARAVAPSLIRYLEPVAAGAQRSRPLRELAEELLDPDAGQTLPGAAGAVQLAGCTPDGDTRIAAALLHGASSAPWDSCDERARALTDAERRSVIHAALEPLGVHDAPPRAFELAEVGFDLVVSASCFAQLKRHRMATLIAQPYDPGLGFTVPPAVREVELEVELERVMRASVRCYEAIAARAPEAAAYALAQAHRRRVLVRMSARELYHFARLRQDHHAQWDIRQIADRMLHLARQVLPEALALACGKDAFAAERARLFPSR